MKNYGCQTCEPDTVESCITTTMELSLKGADWQKWDKLETETQNKIMGIVKKRLSSVSHYFAELVANEH